ncbi:MAG: hypothetical protein GY832_11675 [Chloroflexi bacterium]|nr:hypothetical protein [Chloroflexota bacterium]
MSKLGDTLKLRLKQLVKVRRDYETGMWDDICRFVNPRREDISDTDYTRPKGRRRGEDAYNGTPGGALSVWADGMQGFLVSESLSWFRSELSFHPLNKDDTIRGWLQDYDAAMYEAFRRSNFYPSLALYFRDAGSIGTATIYTEEDIASGTEVHTCIHPREVFIDENKFGVVDTVFRKFEMTARAIVDKFGVDAVSTAIQQNAEKDPSKKHLIAHAVFPSKDGWAKGSSEGTRSGGAKKYRSIYFMAKEITPEGDCILRESGYDIFPYAVWRFRKNSDELYGYSPAAEALVEVFSLNQISKTMLQAAHMAVEGPMNVPSEMRGNVRITPKGNNYYDDPSRIVTPVHTNIQFPLGIDREERLQKSIEDKYRVEFFLTLARAEREMTAFEIAERQSEKAVLMGPQVDQLYREGLLPIFDIVSSFEDAAGRLPPAPDMLRDYPDVQINIQLTGPLAQAQKRLFKMGPIKNGINELAPMAQIWPHVTKKVREMEMAEEILESAAFPQHLIRSDEEVDEMIQAEQEQMQQQQMMEQVGAMADAIPKLSKPVEENSPMEAMAGEV